MRLSGMTIKNFKGIDEDGVHIDFSPITLLFGPNNSGKSTIIQALHIVKEFFCSKNPDFDNIPVANLGNFQNYVHKHELSRNIFIEILLKPYTESDKFLGYNDNHYFNRFILESFQGNPVFPLGISFILSWDDKLYKSRIKDITISLNYESFLIINVDHTSQGNKSAIEGYLTPLTKIANDFIDFYYKLQEEKLSHIKGCEYYPVHPLTIPVTSSGVPDWHSNYAVTAEYTDWSVIGVEREEDTNLVTIQSTLNLPGCRIQCSI